MTSALAHRTIRRFAARPGSVRHSRTIWNHVLMQPDWLDISDSVRWDDGIPRPHWDLIDAWIDTRVPTEMHGEAWTDISRQWLGMLADVFAGSLAVWESDRILMLAPNHEAIASTCLRSAEASMEHIFRSFHDLIEHSFPGKQTMLVLDYPDDYYRYVEPFQPEGQLGGSSGMHIRVGMPHIVIAQANITRVEMTIAHEMTHAALMYLSLPAWIDEGLAQLIERDVIRQSLMLDEKAVQTAKRFWGANGLDIFWRGEGFSMPGKAQQQSYQLAEVLVRLLIEEYRPTWFGWNLEPRRKLIAFLREAKHDDCGEEAARTQLGLGLSEIAGLFLGPGEWGPVL